MSYIPYVDRVLSRRCQCPELRRHVYVFSAWQSNKLLLCIRWDPIIQKPSFFYTHYIQICVSLLSSAMCSRGLPYISLRKIYKKGLHHLAIHSSRASYSTLSLFFETLGNNGILCIYAACYYFSFLSYILVIGLYINKARQETSQSSCGWTDHIHQADKRCRFSFCLVFKCIDTLVSCGRIYTYTHHII